MVLVGGQALGFWMDRFGINPQGAIVSNDGDAIGKLDQARQVAKALHAAIIIPDSRKLTSLIAQIRVQTSSGKFRNIDILRLLFTVDGLRKSNQFTRRVKARSVKVEWLPNQFIQVMHPLDLLESRVHNAAGLVADKGPHVLTQAEWAINVAKAAIVRALLAPSSGPDRVGSMIQFVFQLAHSQAGKRILKDNGIETLHAIPVDEIEAASPQFHPQLERVRAALVKRDFEPLEIARPQNTG